MKIELWTQCFRWNKIKQDSNDASKIIGVISANPAKR